MDPSTGTKLKLPGCIDSHTRFFGTFFLSQQKSTHSIVARCGEGEQCTHFVPSLAEVLTYTLNILLPHVILGK